MTICPDDVFVRYIHFPASTVHEAVVPNDDGTFNVYIEKNLPSNLQRKAFEHAMGHIIRDDFEKVDVQSIEFEAHGEGRSVRVADDDMLLDLMKRIVRSHKKVKRELARYDQMLALLTDKERERLVWRDR